MKYTFTGTVEINGARLKEAELRHALQEAFTDETPMIIVEDWFRDEDKEIEIGELKIASVSKQSKRRATYEQLADVAKVCATVSDTFKRRFALGSAMGPNAYGRTWKYEFVPQAQANGGTTAIVDKCAEIFDELKAAHVNVKSIRFDSGKYTVTFNPYAITQ